MSSCATTTFNVPFFILNQFYNVIAGVLGLFYVLGK